MKTYSAKADDIHHDWFVVDAENLTLGRLATEIAHRLRGKHKPEYTPHMDMGDYVVVVNCEKIRVTGAKRTDKMYYHHTGFPGGIKAASFDQVIESQRSFECTKTNILCAPNDKSCETDNSGLPGVLETGDHGSASQNRIASKLHAT